ncbi:MAG: glycosyltransferase family 2 protein [Gammaproteobacteria bacterium]|nr:glycosyltransferase family 2 protein [Gammaproteobacteria bacterium]
MKISIILPTIRSKSLFELQLPSISNQIFPKDNFELIIIDDYHENREGMVNNYAAEHELNIKWMRSKPAHYRCNANIGCSRNTGLIHATGELVVFIDDYSWIPPGYLEHVWNFYKSCENISLIGPVLTLNFSEPPYPDNIEQFELKHSDCRTKDIPIYQNHYGIKSFQKPLYDEHRHPQTQSPPGWFFTSNATAPLDKLIQANGFWEIADLTREEDALMGLMLDRLGQTFCYSDHPHNRVYHMEHDNTEPMPPDKYKKVIYEDIGWENVTIDGNDTHGGGGNGLNGLSTQEDTIQLVTKDVYNTTYPGSWGLIEYFNTHHDLVFNHDIGFNLSEERNKIGL